MQEIILYATANEVLARVRDRANAKAATPPTLARGCGFRLRIRLFANAYDDTPYPLANLANVTSWAFVMDSDWDSATPFKIVADAGEISVGEVQDQYEGEVVTYTEAVVPVSETNTEELAAWLGSDEGKDGLNAELIGYDGTGEEAFVLQIKGFSVRNRLGSVGDPTPIPSEYLTADQVRALIASGAVLQFSPDGATWKDSQEDGDIYLRFRSASDASAAWSPAIALPRGANGASAYIYVAYASDIMGSNFSLSPTSGLKYRAELQTNIPLESPNASDFSGVTWVKYLGDDGAGAGDMTKAVYDIDDDGVVDSAEKLATARKIGSADFDGTGDISLSDMGAQPALPTNGEEGQFLQKTATGVEWATPPSQAEWGGIGGTLSDQADLKAALDAKADSSALTHYAPKADSLAGYGIADAYTKTEVDAKVSDLNVDELALQEGYYPKLGAGTAENLVDARAQGVDRSFAVDTSCGDASISDNGNALVDVQRGRTVVWNQLVQNGDAHAGTQNWSQYGGTTTSITADSANHIITFKCGNCPHRFVAGGETAMNFRNHVMLNTVWVYVEKALTIDFCLSVYEPGTIDGENMAVNNRSISLPAFAWTRLSYIGKVASDASNQLLELHVSTGGASDLTFQFRDFQVFDLTQMFGQGREPATISEFRAMFTEPWYDYDAGSIVNYRGSAIKTVGFNQYNPSDNFIRVLPHPYQITGTYDGLNYSQWPLRTAPAALSIGQQTSSNTLYSYGNAYYTACMPISDYSPSATYNAGEVCVHDGAWNAALVDISTAEEWNAAHWAYGRGGAATAEVLPFARGAARRRRRVHSFGLRLAVCAGRQRHRHVRAFHVVWLQERRLRGALEQQQGAGCPAVVPGRHERSYC